MAADFVVRPARLRCEVHVASSWNKLQRLCQAHWAGRFSPDIVPDVGFYGVVAPGITVH